MTHFTCPACHAPWPFEITVDTRMQPCGSCPAMVTFDPPQARGIHWWLAGHPDTTVATTDGWLSLADPDADILATDFDCPGCGQAFDPAPKDQGTHACSKCHTRVVVEASGLDARRHHFTVEYGSGVAGALRSGWLVIDTLILARSGADPSQ